VNVEKEYGEKLERVYDMCVERKKKKERKRKKSENKTGKEPGICKDVSAKVHRTDAGTAKGLCKKK